MNDTLKVEILRASERRSYKWPSPDGPDVYYVAYTLAIDGIEAGDVRVYETGEIQMPYGTDPLVRTRAALDRLAGARDLADMRARLAALEAEGQLRPPVLVDVKRDDDGQIDLVFIGAAGFAGNGRGIALKAHEWPLIQHALVAAGLVLAPEVAP